MYTFKYAPITTHQLSHKDLRLAAAEADADGVVAEAYRFALENFLQSDDFLPALMSATTASYSGSGYSVELFVDGTYRVLWNGSIGNLYNSPGIILGLPTWAAEAMDGWAAAGDDPDDYDGSMAMELRDGLDLALEERAAAEEYYREVRYAGGW